MSHVIYFIATAVAPSAFRSTQYQVAHYFNQLDKHIMLNTYMHIAIRPSCIVINYLKGWLYTQC